MCLLEGAEAARATASGMAAVTAALMGQLKAGDHLVAARALFGSCLYVVEELLPRFRHRGDACRRRRSRPMGSRGAAGDQGLLPRNPDQSEPRNLRPESHRGHRAPAWRAACRRQCLRLADLAEAAAARRRLRRLFDDQTYRRPGTMSRRHHPASREFIDTYIHTVSAPDRAAAFALQCLGDAQIAGDPAAARRPPGRERGTDRRLFGRASEREAADLSRAARTIRRRRSRGGR